MKVVLKKMEPVEATEWRKVGDHPLVLDYHAAYNKGFYTPDSNLLETIASVSNNYEGKGLFLDGNNWVLVDVGDFIVDGPDGGSTIFSAENFKATFDPATAEVLAISATNPIGRITISKTNTVIKNEGMSVVGYILASDKSTEMALSFNQTVRWTTAEELYQFVTDATKFGNSNYVSVHKSVLKDMEVLGAKCADSGTCHHNCKEKCFRREGCSPLSIAQPWLNDDWSFKS